MRIARWMAGLATAVLVSACAGPSTSAADRSLPPAPRVRVAALQACPSPGSLADTGGLPALTLPCLGVAGGPVLLRALTGLPTVVNLWASYCGPCREELPAMQRLADRMSGKLRVLGVDSADEAGSAATVIRDLHLSFPMVFDYKGALLRGLIASGAPVLPALPVTVLLRADGTVAKVYQGGALTDATLRSLVNHALGVSS